MKEHDLSVAAFARSETEQPIRCSLGSDYPAGR